jgi:DNA recombination protein RmuC
MVPVVDTPHRYIGRMVLGVVIGLAAGFAVSFAWHMARTARTAGAARLAEGRLADAQARSAALATELRAVSETAAAAETARAVAVSELQLLHRSEDETARRAEEERGRLAGAFSELSAQALAKNNEQFLALADSKLNEVRTATQGDLTQRQQAIAQLLDPLSETLARYERGLRDMEVERKGAYATLSERVAALHLGHEQLQKETRNLVTALRSPQTRGRWGEMTLRNAVKAAGMAEHCDFEEQRSTTTEDGLLRPDMIVHLPGGGQVVIDSKVPLDAFLNFTESDDEDERKVLLKKHAGQLRTHVDQLSKKEYWRQFERSPEFVVAFVPGESLLAAACEADPGLQDHALGKGIVLATPNTLVAALKTIALSWQQETLAESAREVRQLGAELYERLRNMTGHLQSLQRSLTATVEAYNKTVGSFESRVLVSARKFSGLGVVGAQSGGDLLELSPIEKAPRRLQAYQPGLDEDEGAQPTIVALPEGEANTGTPA